MNKLFFNILLLSMAGSLIQAQSEPAIQEPLLPVICRAHKRQYHQFDNHPYLTKEMRTAMRSYLLPVQHPVKRFLDNLFAQSNVIEDEKAFAKAGFQTISKTTTSYIRVAIHPDMPGYVFKVYLCTMHQTRGHRPVWKALTARCQGAENIRQLIEKKRLRHFTVPDKWLYVLPPYELDASDSRKKRQVVLLVATDMQLQKTLETATAWKNIAGTECLDELYCILSHGYASTFLVGNIPYTKKGTFACIDTEFPHRRNQYAKVEKYIAPELIGYWKTLVENGRAADLYAE